MVRQVSSRTESELFKPGDEVSRSGIYRAIHANQHAKPQGRYLRLQRPLSSLEKLRAGRPVCSRARRATHHKPRILQEPLHSHALDAHEEGGGLLSVPRVRWHSAQQYMAALVRSRQRTEDGPTTRGRSRQSRQSPSKKTQGRRHVQAIRRGRDT
jgi:hypothetical protein